MCMSYGQFIPYLFMSHYLFICLLLYLRVCVCLAPEWATECLIRALPSLSIQYIADSATIELSRDCGAEGMKRLTCNGKQDQDMIQRELMCLSERETFTSDNRMKPIIDETQSQRDDEISSQSDNTENNNIDKVANQIEASVVDKVGDKLDLDDIMLGDAPAAIASQEAIDDGDEIKPIKTVKKIAMEKPLKNNPKQMRKLKTSTEHKDELMMGDQAAIVPNVDVAAEEILPHVKKMIEVSTTPRSVLENGQTTTAARSRRETEIPTKTNVSAPTPTTESNTIVKSESEIVQSKILYKDTSFNYFIPPMLLVQHQNSTALPPMIAAAAAAAADVGAEKQTNELTSSTTESIHDGTQMTSSSTSSTQVPTTISSSVETSSSVLTTIASVSNITQETSTTAAAATPTTPISTTTHLQNLPDFPKTNLMRPHAPKFGGEISFHAPAITLTTEKVPIDAVATANDSNSTPETGNTTAIVSTILTENATQANSNEDNSSSSVSTTVKSTELTTEAANMANEPTTVPDVPRLEVAKRSNSAINTDKHQHKEKQQEQQHKSSTHQQTDEANKKHADFTNSNLDYERYKPNRKRILTKPETHTYIQKIFG